MATIKYWNGTAWELAIVGKQGPAGPTGPTGPAGQATMQRYRFTAAGGETSESGADDNGNTLAYTVGLEEVFLNGVLLVRNQDYTASNGTSITGLEALTAGDVLEVLAWGVFNVSNTISTTLIDAKADLLVGTAADTVGRLAVGSNNTVLTADSSTATGLKWAAPAAGANWSLLNAGGTALTGATTVTVNFTAKDKLMILVQNASSANAGSNINLRFNSNTGSNYYRYGVWNYIGTTYAASNFSRLSANSTALVLAGSSDSADYEISGYCLVSGASSSGVKVFNLSGGCQIGSGTGTHSQYITGGYFDSSSAITSVSVIATSGNLDSGTVFIYGSD